MAKRRGRPPRVKKVEQTVETTAPKKDAMGFEAIAPSNADDTVDFEGKSRQSSYDEYAKEAGYDKDNFEGSMTSEDAVGLKMGMGDITPTDDLNTLSTDEATEKPETDTTTEKVDEKEEEVKTETETETETDETDTTTETVEAKDVETKPETELPSDKQDIKELEREAAEKAAKTAKEPQKEDTELVKTVPLGALHEEREKRKTLQKQVEELMGDNKKFMDKLEQTAKPQTDDYISDESPEMLALKRENAEIRDEVHAIKARFEEDDITKEKNRFDTLVDSADKKLSKAGFTGFKNVGLTWVDNRIKEIDKTDPDLAQAYRSPDGWIKLWSEEGFKEVQGIFLEQHKNTTLANKRKLKENINLVTSPGKPAAPTATKEVPYGNFDDYKKEREKYLL